MSGGFLCTSRTSPGHQGKVYKNRSNTYEGTNQTEWQSDGTCRRRSVSAMSFTRASCAASWAARSCCTASSSACFSAISSSSFFALEEHFACARYVHLSGNARIRDFEKGRCPKQAVPQACSLTYRFDYLLQYALVVIQLRFQVICESGVCQHMLQQ